MLRFNLFFIFFLLAWEGAPACAASWRLRARENFETGRFNLEDKRGNLAYRGFLSAFNFFHEKPWKRLVGLTFHRGSLGRIGLQESLTITALGIEGKYFPAPKFPLWFARGGLLAQALDPAGPAKDVWTYGASIGSGFELPIWKLGIAPEIGGKFLFGSAGRKAHSLYMALGLHFYLP